MANAFNFGGVANVSATANRRLRPWDIYRVKFIEAKYDTIKGTKEENKDQVYEMLVVRFENKEGYYEERIFNPGEKGTERFENKNSEGHVYYSPSSMERLQIFVAQMLTVLAPEGMEKMAKIAPKIQSFKQLCDVFAQLLEKAKGKETNLKLVGRKDAQGRVNPALPRFAGVSKDGNLFTSDNFIGDKLFFSTYEEGERKKYLEAKPTNMDKVEPPVGASIDDVPAADAPQEEIDDFEGLLNQ